MIGRNPNAEVYMLEALHQARRAADRGEVPVGAVVVRDGIIIARAYNTRETGKNALYHAELKAIDRACKKLGGWRLPRCELYVTLEPCPMCAGAVINSRVEAVYFGACDKKAGAFGTCFDMISIGLNHSPPVFAGILENECSSLLSDFFSELRRRKTPGAVSENGEK